MAIRGLSKRYTQIILLGLIIHVLLVLAAFDLYFSSPLDHGMTPIKTTDKPSAKRVVLFVADGLRAEAILGRDKEQRTPFLTHVLKHRGSWGVAHTRVPTESRPGHVAMLGGIYEDPSALFKGWKHNPVNFDSVINQSKNAWCWGSPDICYLFNRDNLPHIHLHSYGAEMEDFGKNNTEVLDEWVFSKVKSTLKNLENCKFCDEYFTTGNLFFLHLLGIDTAGHAFKPQSKEYISNIEMVDANINMTYNLFEDVFKDKSTTYIFTSDHGMTNWGSHGAGSDHETETPVVAWGAGIKINKKRRDIQQIDVAPLIASLLGINIPINSLGKLPYQYLNTSQQNIAKLMISNVQQLVQIFNVKRNRIKNNAMIYVPFKDISSEYLRNVMQQLDDLYDSQKYEILIAMCQTFMEELINGLDYYHYYYQLPVLVSVSIGFISWLIYLIISIVSDPSAKHIKRKPSYGILLMIIVATVIVCFKHKFPITYYLHFLFPVIMIFILCQKKDVIKDIIRGIKLFGITNTVINLLFYVIGIELLVRGFANRLYYSFLMILTGLWITMSESLRDNTNLKDKFIWISCSLILAIFPALPVMNTAFNVPFYLLGAMVWILYFVEMFGHLSLYKHLENLNWTCFSVSIQITCLVGSIVYMMALEFNYFSNESCIKYLPWFLALVPIFLIPQVSKIIHIRLISIYFGFAPYFLLVTSSFEGLFLIFFIILLNHWLLIECKTFKKEKAIFFSSFDFYNVSDNKFNIDIFRRGFLFMVFIFLGFFGMGNIASINSFDPMWVRAFLTVFSPFKMMSIIIVKIIIPFVFVCCIFRAINTVAKENMLSMFCIILVFSDLMVLQCLYLITNKGSWLDIGTSLSHFLIMEGFVTIILFLYGISQILTTSKYVKADQSISYKLL